MNDNEIENLIDNFNNSLVLDSSSESEDLNMNANDANRGNPINYQLLKLHVDTIPYYNGDSHTLKIFISSCDYLFATYVNNNDAQLKTYLLRVVIGKLTDRAQILIGTRNELTTWTLIKAALRQSFGDQRNLDCLEQDLITLQPFRGESPLEFGKRIQIARSRLASKISSISDTVMPQATKVVYLRQYDQVALKTFIRGLSGNMQSIVRLRNPDSLEMAMNFVTEEENFRYTQNLPQALTRHNTQKAPQANNVSRLQNHRFNKPLIPQTYAPAYPMQSHYNPNYTPFQRFNAPSSRTHTTFPNQPINIQSRPIQHKFPTNAQVFGPPKNVFKPTGQKPTNIPEPMSTTSHIPTIRRPPSNYFQSTGPRNFISQELNQMDEDPYLYEQYDPNMYNENQTEDDYFNCYYENTYHENQHYAADTLQYEPLPNNQSNYYYSSVDTTNNDPSGDVNFPTAGRTSNPT